MQIQVLASNKKEKPPFRESKLTRLLSNAIGGGAKTCLIICVAPTIIDQVETCMDACMHAHTQPDHHLRRADDH